MKRREFIAFAGVALAQICVAHAQPDARIRRIGFLSGVPVEDPLSKARLDAFLTEMQRLGWINGRNMRMDYRAGARDPRSLRQLTEELLALAPDVILVNGTEVAEPLRQATRNLPIVFVQVSDPVGAGLVASLSRPGGNITGFANLEFGMTGKWLELLKEIAPKVTRVGVLRDSTNVTGIAQLAAMQSVARTLGFDVQPLNLRDAEAIERDVSAFARDPKWRAGLDGRQPLGPAPRFDRRSCCSPPHARRLSRSFCCSSRRAGVAWQRFGRYLSPRSRIH
jgi:putative ABC transport system substrate-binding protein